MRHLTVQSKADFLARTRVWARADQTAHEAGLNNAFVQISNEFISTVALLASESPAAAAVLLLMVAHMDRFGTVCCDFEMLMEGTGRKKSTVYAALKTLETELWVRRCTRNGASFYRVNARVFWAARANQRHLGFASELNRQKGPETGKPRIRVIVREFPSSDSRRMGQSAP